MDGVQDGGQDAAGECLDITEAARRLGIAKEALRKRIARGTVRAEKGPDGAGTSSYPPGRSRSATGRTAGRTQAGQELAPPWPRVS